MIVISCSSGMTHPLNKTMATVLAAVALFMTIYCGLLQNHEDPPIISLDDPAIMLAKAE